MEKLNWEISYEKYKEVCEKIQDLLSKWNYACQVLDYIPFENVEIMKKIWDDCDKFKDDIEKLQNARDQFWNLFMEQKYGKDWDKSE